MGLKFTTAKNIVDLKKTLNADPQCEIIKFVSKIRRKAVRSFRFGESIPDNVTIQ